jgi:hypothetical protein
MTVRIPVDVKQQVDEIVDRFRDGDLELAKTANSDEHKISQLKTIIARYQTESKSSSDWTKCNQLIQELVAQIERHE